MINRRGSYLKTDIDLLNVKIFRKCRVCGIEAHSREALQHFVKEKKSRFGRANICNSCWSKQVMIYEKRRKRERLPPVQGNSLKQALAYANYVTSDKE